MRSRKHAAATLLVVTGYLLAIVVSSPALHHGEHYCGLPGHVCDSVHTHRPNVKSCGHSPQHADSHRPEDHRDKQGPSRSHDEGTCPICKFPGQKLILGANVVEVASVFLEQEPERTEPTQRAKPVPSTHHIRAPPAVA